MIWREEKKSKQNSATTKLIFAQLAPKEPKGARDRAQFVKFALFLWNYKKGKSAALANNHLIFIRTTSNFVPLRGTTLDIRSYL